MDSINQEILDSQVFKNLRRSVLEDYDARAFPSAIFRSNTPEVDWDLGLFIISAFDHDGSPEVQQAVMEIAFGAIQSSSSTTENKTAAALILERFGNWPSIDLAIEREKISRNYRKELPLPLCYDSISAKLEHTIQPLAGQSFLGSDFQKNFWRLAQSNAWLSVSAPTSAGKSYVVKRWVIDQAMQENSPVVLYIVPTRALVDEVSKELLEEPALEGIHIHSIPWDPRLKEPGARIVVMTQERAQITFDRHPSLKPSAIFVDEAQKIGEGYRGILLEEIIQESLRRNNSLKAVFASPMTENPEDLLSRSTNEGQRESFISPIPSVCQNLYWINPVPRHSPTWKIERSADGEMREVGTVLLDEEPNPPSKRLSSIPTKLSAPDALNIVYANTPADAEKYAKQIYEFLGPESLIDDEKISDLQELIANSVHSSYLLREVISRGVAFHYGNIPQSVRKGVEELYRAGIIKYLVCTSTLLEGVNLPCTNIWIMNPQRGRGNPMTPFDFWNLAGRAGRWGAEFVGNICCIGTRSRPAWKSEPPTKRTSGSISFASESALSSVDRISKFIREDGKHEHGKKDEELEAISAFLFDAASRKERPIALRAISEDVGNELLATFTEKEQKLDVPEHVRRAHPGINPQAMQRLLTDIRAKDPLTLPLLSPHDEGAYEQMIRAMARCERNMQAGFGPSSNQARLSALLLNWMRGASIPSLVQNRIIYERENKPDSFSTAKCIRAVLSDVEQVARFRAPKYLSCYMDIVDLVVPPRDTKESQPDVSMMLELGVSRETDVSLVSLGLSRTAAITVSQFIRESNLKPSEAVEWLSSQDFSSLDIPAVLVREIDSVLQSVRYRSL